ncbi:MAG: HTH domain-containing protein [Candidatus Coproplasma sp.]
MSLKSEILKKLEENRGAYLSGENLSESFGVTRQAVWKAVKKLTEEGYIINSVTNKGYMLDGKCDLLSSAVISDKTGAKVFCFDEVGSTNTVAFQKLYAEGECLVVAERQSMGRTKNGEKFISPTQKGIYMSVANLCNQPVERADELRARCAELVARVICNYCGNMPEIRNLDELYLDGKKVCGILIEGEINLATNRITKAVIGIGIYTAEVSERFGYIDSTEPRNALICDIYKAVKNLMN